MYQDVKNINIQLDDATLFILKKLKENGCEVYVVGGSLRNSLLGIPSHDTDIATNALPEQVKKIFCGYPVLETGLKHGTVTLMINHTPYEITTFRTEGIYSDNRRPDTVCFTSSLEEDLKRRDFTVNALAFSPDTGIVDLFGGINDIKNRIIRAVGDPSERFGEDALRILRALRFASVLGFSVEEKTAEAIFDCSQLLKKISCERIFSEIKGFLNGKYYYSVLRQFYPVFSLVLPEMIMPKKEIETNQNIYFRLASLFKNPADAKEALYRLKSDNNTLKLTSLLAGSSAVPQSKSKIKQFLREHGAENAILVAEFREVYYSEPDSVLRVQSVIESGECYSLSQLAVNGNDLCLLGFSGIVIGKKLDEILNLVINDVLPNEKNELLNYAKSSPKIIDNN